MQSKEKQFLSIEEIAALVRAFESCSVAPGEFSHRRHLAVALHYLLESDRELAAWSMRNGLKNLLAHHRIDGYNETITVFWIRILNSLIANPRGRTFDPVEFNRVLDASCDSKLLFTYFSRDRVMSDQAKREWVEPDLRPMSD